ncbi:MAG TPA: hypothetical protein VH596_17405 [Terriglobales bacterium]|jgi:hypothetical protein
MDLSAKEYIARFEAGAIAPDAFHHADHVRLAFAYLQEYPVLDALGKFSAALKRFAAEQGKADRYHETITFAYFFLIQERMTRGGHPAWEQFARENADLFVWQKSILNGYYEELTLKSELARSTFVLPDRH